MALPSPSLDTITLTGGIHGPGAFSIDSSGNATVNNLTVDGSFGLSNLTLASLAMTGPITTESELFVVGSRAWSGTTLAQVPITTGDSGMTWTGTVPGLAGGLVPLFMEIGVAANLNASATGGAAAIQLFAGTGTLLQGGLTGIKSTLHVGLTSNTGGNEYVALRGFVYGDADDGSHDGNLIAQTLVTQPNAGTWAFSAVSELATQALAGVTLTAKYGQFLKLYSSDAVQGTDVDAAYIMWADSISTSSKGWKVGWQIGNSFFGSFQPLASNATMFLFDPKSGDETAIGTIFDFHKYTSITGNILNAPTMQINGAGSIYATDYRVFGSGDGPMDLYSLGTGGFLFKTADTPGGGALLSVANSNPGTTVTSGFNLTAGAGFAEITLSGTNPQFFINSSGTGYIGFQSGAPTKIDYLGNITAPSLGLNGSTSGTISILAAAIAGSNTVTVPAATGTMAVYGAEAAATTPVTFSAAARIPIVIGGTTYYIPLATVTW